MYYLIELKFLLWGSLNFSNAFYRVHQFKYFNLQEKNLDESTFNVDTLYFKNVICLGKFISFKNGKIYDNLLNVNTNKLKQE